MRIPLIIMRLHATCALHVADTAWMRAANTAGMRAGGDYVCSLRWPWLRLPCCLRLNSGVACAVWCALLRTRASNGVARGTKLRSRHPKDTDATTVPDRSFRRDRRSVGWGEGRRARRGVGGLASLAVDVELALGASETRGVGCGRATLGRVPLRDARGANRALTLVGSRPRVAPLVRLRRLYRMRRRSASCLQSCRQCMRSRRGLPSQPGARGPLGLGHAGIVWSRVRPEVMTWPCGSRNSMLPFSVR